MSLRPRAATAAAAAPAARTRLDAVLRAGMGVGAWKEGDKRADYRMLYDGRKNLWEELEHAGWSGRTPESEALDRILAGKVDAEDLQTLAPMARAFFVNVIQPRLPRRFFERNVVRDSGLRGTGYLTVESVVSDMEAVAHALAERRIAQALAAKLKRGKRGGGSSSSKRY